MIEKMLEIKKNYSLKKYNTFAIDEKTDFFAEIKTFADLQKILGMEKFREIPKFILGGGSNILLTKKVKGLVLHINILGKNIVQENENKIEIEVMSGENWHEFVLWCVKNGWGGVENLSLIPGKVGTAPMQNIGAYGVEVKNVIKKVKTMEIKTGKIREFKNKDCQFGYRDSVFKNELKNELIITSVVFELTKKKHSFCLKYAGISEKLETDNLEISLQNISETVIKIRQKKIPDVDKIPNSGSFFKNPIVAKKKFEALYSKFSEMPFYKLPDNEVKIPAGWLIEKAGWKGFREKNCGVHKYQALVLVNFGNSTGTEILNLAEKIKTDVFKKFGISLKTEVNVF